MSGSNELLGRNGFIWHQCKKSLHLMLVQRIVNCSDQVGFSALFLEYYHYFRYNFEKMYKKLHCKKPIIKKEKKTFTIEKSRNAFIKNK